MLIRAIIFLISSIKYTVHLKNYEPLIIKMILKLIQYHLNIMGRLRIATMWQITALSK